MNDDNTKTFIENLPAILMALAAVIGSLSALVVGFLSNSRSRENGKKIDRVEAAVNGQTDRKVAEALVTGHAAGVESERVRNE